MKIRESLPADTESIRTLHREAFGEAEGESVSGLAVDLLDDPSASPIVSFVAEQQGKVIGNVIFTAVKIDGSATIAKVHIMAPLAVATKFQGTGIGTALIEHGLEKLQELGTSIVLVLGDPNYYSRAGFTAAHNIAPPYELDYPEAWMALELIEGALEHTSGTAQCATCLNSPEHW